jgi:competence protein ComEC
VLSLFSLCLLLIVGYSPDRWSGAASVSFIDVGQGDCSLIRTSSGSYTLIDGGGTVQFRKPGDSWRDRKDPYEVGRKLVVPLLKQRGVHKLDQVLISHEDADHVGGLQAVLEEIPVDRILFNGTFKPTPGVKKLFQTALSRNIALVEVTPGQTIQLDTKAQLHILFPTPAPTAVQSQPELQIAPQQNNLSVVALLEMEGVKWLFTGDMEQAVEVKVLNTITKILPQPSGLQIDVLKVAHHGSKTSTTEAWLKYWKPKIAVISVGRTNSYGHPSPVVVKRLADFGIPALRTDKYGEVQMTINGGKLYTRTKLGGSSSLNLF